MDPIIAKNLLSINTKKSTTTKKKCCQEMKSLLDVTNKCENQFILKP